ncbi:MAG: outer membrane protein assembly factor BamC [Pigmentiphaga sp.]|nr:outer membrane protein assembly factor BamC [Pigmentiphaga sp.]
MIKDLRIAGSVAVLLALAGCSSVNQFLGKEESVDYQSSAPIRGNGLSVPPDLTQVPPSQRFQVPQAPGGTTYSEYASAQAQRQAVGASHQQSRVLPQYEDIRVERDGMNRWLVVNRSADQLYDETLDFWRSQGFTINTENPAAGIIETDWAENRANIPQDFLRRTLGRVIDQVYDSGKRERFRTRFERGSGGAIEIYITHQQMVEELVSESRTVWVEGEPDPQLDAAMLSRLMVYLGASQEQADAAIAQAATTPTVPVQLTQVATGSGAEGALDIQEPFDRAWRRVGLALDRGNFTVEDRDRTMGQYFVRYVDVDAVQPAEPGFFSRLFSRKPPPQAPQYRVQLTDVGGATRVTVLDADGNPDRSPTAGRILDVLLQQLQN